MIFDREPIYRTDIYNKTELFWAGLRKEQRCACPGSRWVEVEYAIRNEQRNEPNQKLTLFLSVVT